MSLLVGQAAEEGEAHTLAKPNLAGVDVECLFLAQPHPRRVSQRKDGGYG